MRLRGDLHGTFRVLFTVFPGSGFRRLDGGTEEKTLARGEVFEHHGAITLRMDILFHWRNGSTPSHETPSVSDVGYEFRIL